MAFRFGKVLGFVWRQRLRLWTGAYLAALLLLLLFPPWIRALNGSDEVIRYWGCDGQLFSGVCTAGHHWIASESFSNPDQAVGKMINWPGLWYQIAIATLVFLIPVLPARISRVKTRSRPSE